MAAKGTWLDQLRQVLRLKHLSIRPEKSYVHGVKRFILFHHKRHPKDMGAPEIRQLREVGTVRCSRPQSL